MVVTLDISRLVFFLNTVSVTFCLCLLPGSAIIILLSSLWVCCHLAKKYAHHVRQNGIEQFLSIYHRVKDRKHDRLRWGDEIEYMVISYDEENHNARLSLRVFEILAELEKEEKEAQGDPE
ncbi:hypothetical protein BDF19DRAFT_431410 [Syncephalis fuscata]|nr:hypothetical protein BDF19DRAFT_431410 [Syncephalis fuscata]